MLPPAAEWASNTGSSEQTACSLTVSVHLTAPLTGDGSNRSVRVALKDWFLAVPRPTVCTSLWIHTALVPQLEVELEVTVNCAASSVATDSSAAADRNPEEVLSITSGLCGSIIMLTLPPWMEYTFAGDCDWPETALTRQASTRMRIFAADFTPLSRNP